MRQPLQFIILVLLINLINLLLLFALMKRGIGTQASEIVYTLTLTLGLLFLELFILRFISNKTFFSYDLKRFSEVTPCIFLLLLLSFLIFHGLAVFETFTNYKVLTHMFSYEFTLFVKTLFWIFGGIIFLYLCLFILKDISRKTDLSLFAIFILSYSGVFSLYTTNCSFRYYLAFYALCLIYLAVKMRTNIKNALPLLTSLVGMAFLVNGSIFKIIYTPFKAEKSIEFTIGGKQNETSAHFLPNKPLIDFLKENKIGNYYYLSDRFFLEKPIQFYKIITPWKENAHRNAIIGYDYSNGKKGGYILYIKE